MQSAGAGVDRGLSTEEREAEVQRLAQVEAALPFDLGAGPLLRARLLRLGAEEHVALLTMHHIVSDGWSIGILIREVAALYEAFSGGQESPLPELPIQYADYAVWQREWLQGEVLEKQLELLARAVGGSAGAVGVADGSAAAGGAEFCGRVREFSG